MEDTNNVKRDDWNRFVIENSGSFLQSHEWGEFQKSFGRQVFFLKDTDWQAFVIRHKLPLRKSYLYCPRGPVIPSEARNHSRMRNFINKTKELAKQENVIFLRIEPTFEISNEELKESDFVKTKDIQPSKTLILDLNLTEEELLAQMHEKTRYNIGLAARKRVLVKNFQFSMTNFSPFGRSPAGRQSIFNEQFENFWRLLSATARRQRIRLHDKEYYRKLLTMRRSQTSTESFKNLLFIAEYNNKPVAANMVNVFSNRATYLHGGSDNEYRSLMAPHLLQWEQIKFAKSVGCKIYDFWGCDDKKWPGITRFKKGFGGREVNYIGTWDFVFNRKWYKIYKLARGILK